MAGEILQGFQVGMNAALRMQELRSEQAARAARERAVAQEMAITMEKRDLAIQYRADMAKAVGKAQMMASPEVLVPGLDGSGTFSIPNPNRISEEDAAFQNVLPVVAKYEPDKVPQVLQGIATARYRQGQETRLNKQEERLSKGATPGMASPLGKEVADYQYFIESGNVEAANFAKAALLKRGADSGFQIEFDADGKVKNISQGARSGALGSPTTSTTTKIQQSLGETEKTVSALADLERTIRPKDIGIRGVIGEEVLDRIAPQFGLDTADVKRMNSRAKLRAVVQGALREVSDDTRFTENDRKAVEKILPREGWKESYQNAMQSSKTLRLIMAKRAIVDSKTLGQKPPTWVFKHLDKEAVEDAAINGQLDDEGLIAAFQSGAITQAEAVRLRRGRKQ